MIKAGQIDKSTFLFFKNEPCMVVEREFVNPGKGSAFCRVRLKGLTTAKVYQETFKTQDTVEDIQVEEKTCQYLFSDNESYHFMHNDTYEQFEVPLEGLEDRLQYMKDGESYRVVLWEDKPIDIKIPPKVVYTVVDAPEAIKGDTATNVTKVVTLDTGLKVKAPFFIKEGEKILVNTETNEYVERVNE